MSSAWTFVSRLVVRCAGFSIEPLLALGRERGARAIDAVLACETEAAQLNAQLGECFRACVLEARARGDAEGLANLSKARRAVAMGRLVEAQTLCACLNDAALQAALQACQAGQKRSLQQVAQARSLFADELGAMRGQLWATCRDPWVQEALFISNPDAYERTLGPYLSGPPPGAQRSGKLRKIERRLVTYLQRFCAKNDTASFFGPMNYGVLGHGEAEPVICSRRPGKARERRSYYSFWMVAALAQAVADDPAIRPLLLPALHPMWRVTGPNLQRVYGGETFPLAAATAEVLAAIDGKTPLQALRAGAAQPARFDAVFSRLLEKSVVRLEIPLPSTIFDPMKFLMGFVEGLPAALPARAAWLERLLPFGEWMSLVHAADLAEKQRIGALIEQHFTALTGQASRRLAGMIYADRTLFYEECEGTIERLSFSESFSRDLGDRLSLALALSGSYGQLLERQYQRVARRAFRQIAGGSTHMAYGQFISGLEALSARGELDTRDAEREEFEARFTALIAARPGVSVVRLGPDDLAPLLKDNPQQGLHISPDLMFDAPSLEALGRGDYRLVLGEVHQFLAMWGSQLLFDRQAAQIRQETLSLLERLPDYRGLATILHTRVHKGLLHESFPGKWIELLGWPAPDAKQVVALRDLVVVDTGEALQLQSSRDGERLVIYNSGDDKLHLWAFAVPRVMTVPVELPGHTPRIEIGGVVYQRERWELGAGQMPQFDAEDDEFGIFLKVRRMQQQHGLPRFVFYRVASEKKPLFLDFDNYLLVELFAANLAQNTEVVISEMLPAPDGLWMRDGDGRYCIEMRGTAFRVPVSASCTQVSTRQEAEKVSAA